jgi:hypothetical protein
MILKTEVEEQIVLIWLWTRSSCEILRRESQNSGFHIMLEISEWVSNYKLLKKNIMLKLHKMDQQDMSVRGQSWQSAVSSQS